MALRVKPAPTRFPTNSLYTSMGNKPLHSISSVCHPWVRCRRLERVIRIPELKALWECGFLTEQFRHSFWG